MKKFLLILSILLFTSTNCFAGNNCTYNCVAPYDLSCGVSRFFSTITGSNFVGRHVAGSVLKKEINKNVEGKISVNINSYSVRDLKKGIFKTMTIKGKNVNIKGVHFTSLKLRTICGFNYISIKDRKNPVFKEDLPINFSVTITENDLNKTMETSGYKKIINDLNSVGNLLGGLFQISGSQIKIQNSKFFYILKVSIPFVRATQNIILTSDLKVVKGEIDFNNTRFVNNSIAIDLSKIDKIINYLNPLDFSLDILENKDTKLTVHSVKIEDNKIYADGTILVSKD